MSLPTQSLSPSPHDTAAERSEAADIFPHHYTVTSIREQYGAALRKFDWSYLIEALPVPTAPATSSTPSHGMGDSAITRMIEAVVTDLTHVQGNPVCYAYTLETSKSGWRHPHVYLGNISRLAADQIVSVFQAHRFGAVNVRRWDREKEHGYAFKSLDPKDPSYDEDAVWHFDVKWNRTFKQQMKLCRKHLDKLDGPKDWSSADCAISLSTLPHMYG